MTLSIPLTINIQYSASNRPPHRFPPAIINIHIGAHIRPVPINGKNDAIRVIKPNNIGAGTPKAI